MSEKALGSGGKENEWASWGCEGTGGPATDICLGRADGFPWAHVRGLVGGTAVQASTFAPGDGVCEEELWLWAQGLETRRNCGIRLPIPWTPGTETVAWPQGQRSVTTSGVSRQNGL